MMIRLLLLLLGLTCFATWAGTCSECAAGRHRNCTGSSRNPCDCAKNGHK